MALPRFQRTAFEPTESVFISLNTTTITIIPSYPISRFRTLDGNLIGPLKPLKPSIVPLWLAIQSKKKKRAKILCPDWLLVENLESRLRVEVGEPRFSELPFYWLEISKVLIEVAPDDIPSTSTVRSLLKSLREARQSKTRSGLIGLDSLHLATPNLGSLELNELRPIFCGGHLRLLQLDPNQDSYESFLSQIELHHTRQSQQQQQSTGQMEFEHHSHQGKDDDDDEQMNDLTKDYNSTHQFRSSSTSS